MSTTHSPAQYSATRRNGILAILCLSVFLIVVDNTIVNVALPTLVRELGATTSQLQWIVDAYTLVFAGLLLAAGSLGDRLGRKGVLMIGLAWFGVFSAAAAFTNSADGLIAMRALMGVGAALIFPATLAILVNVFTEPRERARAISIWAAVSGLSVALGPVSGGFLLEHFWWGSVFLINVPIVLVALLLVGRMVPTSRDEHITRFDPLGFVLSIASITVLVFTIIEAPNHGWTSTFSLAGFALAAALLVGFIQWERRTDHPMLDVGVFRHARFSAASVAIAGAFFALFGFVFMVTQYFQFVRGYSTLSAGVHTVPFAIFTGITAPLSPKFVRRFGSNRVVGTGLAMMAGGFVVAALTTATAPYAVIVLAMFGMGSGLGLVTAPATESIMGSLPAEKAGVGSAVNDTTRELGGTLGVAVVGSVFASLYGSRLVDNLAALPIPAAALDIAKESIGAAFVVAERAPSPEAAAAITDAARDAFMSGFHAGSLAAAAVAAVAAVAAWFWLPARAEDEVDVDRELEHA
ncbi:MAG TPA: MFS transporter, partial [Acidimicrobiia bacterium]|nr:MFS transporter [Acidimicrobiia bacterium]